jgi:hypothetical protein
LTLQGSAATIQIQEIAGVCLNSTRTVEIMGSPAQANVHLELINSSGEARFNSSNGPTVLDISGLPKQVTIYGRTTSSMVDGITLRATMTSGGSATTEERFSVVRLTQLEVHDAILQTTPRGDYYLSTVISDNDVAVEARLDPNLTGTTDAGIISWTGGKPETNVPLRRIVTTATSVTTVTAQCGSQSMSVIIVIAQGCGTGMNDQRSQIQGEYLYYWAFAGLGNLDPKCSEFTQSARSQYFSFSELNTGDYSWALIRQPLVISQTSGYGLDRWRVEYGGPRTINSAYRNPVHNDRIGGATNSRHMFGDAVDLRNESRTEGEWNAMVKAAGEGRANADFIEPRNGPCGIGCVHADWRDHPGGYVP